MKILSVSDRVESILYDQFDADLFPGVDLVISCGDLPPEYLMFLVTKFNVPLYYVKGNHDIRYDSKPPVRCTDLNARIIQFQGLNLLGLEGSHWYNGGANQYTEGQMRRTIRLLKLKIRWQGGVDIVITHAPPRYIHDAEDPCHKGFESFRRLIDRYAPAYFIHGHIHMNFNSPSERITTVNRTKVVNSYGYYLFEINDSPTVQ